MDSGIIPASVAEKQGISQSFSTCPVLLTVTQFAQKHRAFSASSLRNLIFLASDRHTSKGIIPGNGMNLAVIRVGRRVLIHEARFFAWVEGQRS